MGASDFTRMTACIGGCGKQVPYKTSNRVYCDPCRAAAKRESARLAAERKRRAKGIAPVKGTPALCERCGDGFVRNSINAKFCEPCRPIAALERANEYQKRLRKDGATWIKLNPEKAREYWAKHRAANPDKYRDAVARYRKRNPEKAREYYRANKESIDAYRRAWTERVYKVERRDHRRKLTKASRQRKKDRMGPAFQINERMSANIRQSLRRGKGGNSWEKLVGYTLDDLASHLEKQFTKGMSWENIGQWHIDHVCPLASFKYESYECEAFRQAWCLSNLRPLWAIDNLRKNDKRTHLI